MAAHAVAMRVSPKRLRRTFGAASCVRESARFAANELRDVPALRRYRLRGSDLFTFVRHPLLDMWSLEEIFRFGVYEPPVHVARLLEAAQRPLQVVDLGGNVGHFGLYVRTLFPDASVVSFEPDPGNAAVLSRCIDANGLAGSWRLVEACASTSEGRVEFASSGPLSRAAPPSDGALEELQEHIGRVFPFVRGTTLLEPARLEVATRDAFPLLAGADLVKIDIEGGEWEILADPRMADLRAAAFVLEYHLPYGPEGDAEGTVRRAFGQAGYEVGPSVPGDGAAVLWAWRRDGRTS
jgi:FkbM family methyltransferase